jgi:uncharacterized protein YybS (DUF2232 family)
VKSLAAKEKTRSMVEAAMLAALTVILLLPTIYLPLLGMITLFIWPVPITVLGVRHGLKSSILAMVTAAFITSILTHPLTVGSLVIWLGFLGIALGYCFREKWPPAKTLGVGTLTVLASTLLLFLLTLLVFGVNPLTAGQTMLAESSSQALEIYRGLGLPEGQLDRMEEYYLEMVEMFRYLLPATLLLGSVFATFINFSVARLVLGKLGQEVPGLPPFATWQFPRNLLLGYLVGILFVLGGNYYGQSLLLEIGLNIQVIFNLVLALAGLTVVHHLLRRYSLPKTLIILASGIIILNPIFLQLVTLLGIIDIAFNLRRL